MHPAIARPGAC